MAVLDNSELKIGFWFGLGFVAAAAVWGLLSLWLGRLAHRGHG